PADPVLVNAAIAQSARARGRLARWVEGFDGNARTGLTNFHGVFRLVMRGLDPRIHRESLSGSAR
ncbi:MAG TPA: hypothetical protein VHG27_10290, partial [Xanthobacteraceae bacterium]|nr:hypothetical protein [Xanthobacteraceae bacterium]